jgi:hypothetical protein
MVQAISSVAATSILPVRDQAVGNQPKSDQSAQPQASQAAGSAGAAVPFALRGDTTGDASKALQKMLSPLIPTDAHLAISQDEFISRFIYRFVDPHGKTLRQYPRQMVVDSLHAMESGVQRFLDERA